MSEDNLHDAWRRFRRGKRLRPDVIACARQIDDAIAQLSEDLASGRYRHGAYDTFIVRDPKQRVIHKATVRDRVIHQALYDALAPWWERRFLPQSYGCRPRRGVHRAIVRAALLLRQASRNGHSDAFVLHGDVRQFFPSIDHATLRVLLRRCVTDVRIHALCDAVIGSFAASPGRGLPLGNLTSQLFGNVFLHELDRFVVHTLRFSAYVRYADDFFLIGNDRSVLDTVREPIAEFLRGHLHLTCSMLAVFRWSHGVDVLGAVAFPWGIVPRRRQRLAAERCAREVAADRYTTDGWRRAVSYLGMLDQTRSFTIRTHLRAAYAPSP